MKKLVHQQNMVIIIIFLKMTDYKTNMFYIAQKMKIVQMRKYLLILINFQKMEPFQWLGGVLQKMVLCLHT